MSGLIQEEERPPKSSPDTTADASLLNGDSGKGVSLKRDVGLIGRNGLGCVGFMRLFGCFWCLGVRWTWYNDPCFWRRVYLSPWGIWSASGLPLHMDCLYRYKAVSACYYLPYIWRVCSYTFLSWLLVASGYSTDNQAFGCFCHW